MSDLQDQSVLDGQLTDAFIIMNQVLRKHQAYISAKYRLAPFEMELLFFLITEEAQRMKDIARHFGIKLSTLTSIVDKAEKNKIVERAHSKSDRRVVFLKATTKGKRVVDTYKEFQKQVALQMQEEMENPDFNSFVQSLNALITGIESQYSGSEK
ncbi:MAG: MarR family winged helix-turn-helix transcriptional regulator [Bacteroidia bacterium]|nr:MarR family winged helix-turn-helix transcriptional regulator [Bacteroidia bacterium]